MTISSILNKLCFGSVIYGASLATTDQIPLSGDSTSLASPPLLGFGTWNLKISPWNTSAAVSAAIQLGYRHIDCASVYGNQKEVGAGIQDGIRKARIKREDVWVTSKLWNTDHGSGISKALDETLNDLDVGYLDLYLMHWPVANTNGRNTIEYLQTWEAMTHLPKSLVRNIGISNFSPYQLENLIANISVKPFAHQYESHPYLQQTKWLAYHKKHGIHVTAYSPLANLNPTYDHGKHIPTILTDHDISAVAKERGCSNVQVVLAWGIHRGTSVIPKSSHESRIRENGASVDCHLKEEDIKRIDAIQSRFVKRFNNPSKEWGLELYEGLEGK